jgi:hypothetical protein
MVALVLDVVMASELGELQLESLLRHDEIIFLDAPIILLCMFWSMETVGQLLKP